MSTADFVPVLPPAVPKSEQEAENLGRGGTWASQDTPLHLALIQNRAAAAYHRARGAAVPAFPETGNNIEWHNAITGSTRNTVDLSLDDLRRQGVYTTTNAEKP